MTLHNAFVNTPLLELSDMPNGGSDKSLKKRYSFNSVRPGAGAGASSGFVALEADKYATKETR